MSTGEVGRIGRWQPGRLCTSVNGGELVQWSKDGLLVRGLRTRARAAMLYWRLALGMQVDAGEILARDPRNFGY